MKRYLLWRDNQESGPYTLEQLRAREIRTFDLLKPEGNHSFWAYPAQIEELKGIVQSNRQTSAAILTFPTRAIPVSSWISGGLFFLIASIMWYRTTVYNSGSGLNDPFHSNAGLVHGLPEDIIPERSTDEAYQNALTIEIVPVDTSREQIPVESSLSPAELLKCVHIKGNIEKNGIYGKINDLMLHIHNTSSLQLDSVTITVEFTRLGEKSIKTEKYVVHDLRPNGKRTLTVTLSKKDIKVNYKIIDVKPRENKTVFVFT